MVGPALGLYASLRTLQNAGASIERHVAAASSARQFDRVLREHPRTANIDVVTGERRAALARDQLEATLRETLSETREATATDEEARLVAALETRTETYLTRRRELDGQGLPLEQIITTVQPSLEEALVASSANRTHHLRALDEDRSNAQDAFRWAVNLAAAPSLLLILALGLVLWAVRSQILRPVLNLQGAFARFRGGETSARASASGAVELRELTDDFNRMAERLASARRDQLTFLSAVAHDLRTPLAALRLAVNLAEEDSGEASRGALERIDKQIDRLDFMVGDLLDMTRIEAGELELRLEGIDLRETLRAVVDLYGPTSAAHEIVVRAPAEPVGVEADPGRMEQVIGNLVSNAIKYSPSGGAITMTLALDGGEAVLSVSDQGLGIAPEALEEIFTPFKRPGGIRGIAPGVGLGLSIVRRIVGAHGGSIEVDSEVGVGSTFRVRIPATKPALS